MENSKDGLMHFLKARSMGPAIKYRMTFMNEGCPIISIMELKPTPGQKRPQKLLTMGTVHRCLEKPIKIREARKSSLPAAV
jgi:hypothetical protein